LKKVILLGIEGFGGQWPEPCELSDLEIVAIVDSNPEALERAKKRFDLSDDRFFDGSDLSWTQVEADGIIEATAPGGRVDRVMAALESGKDVIMAKPPVLNLEDLLAIRDRKNELGQQVHVATQKRYFPAYYKIKSIIEHEDIGQLSYADINLRVDGTYWKSGFYWRRKLPFPSLMDGSIHHFDLLCWWTGAGFADVTASSWNPSWSPFVNDCDMASVIHMDNGATVHYQSRWSMKEGPVINYFDGIRLEFTNAVLEVIGGKLYQNGRYVPLIGDGQTMMDTGKLNIYILSDMLKSIEHKRDFYKTSVENHIEPFKCVIASVGSILSGKRVALKGLEEHLEDYNVSRPQLNAMMEHVFDRDM